MLQKTLNNKLRIVQLIILVVLLALIRAFENELFYDPFLAFFKQDFTNLSLPKVDSFLLFLGLLFRYALNTALSLGVIYIIFQEVTMVKFALVLYSFFFLISTIAFFYIVLFTTENYNWILFYVGRFLIKPIFFILFIPGFFYKKSRT